MAWLGLAKAHAGAKYSLVTANHHSKDDVSQLSPQIRSRLRLFFAPHNRELNRLARDRFGVQTAVLAGDAEATLDVNVPLPVA